MATVTINKGIYRGNEITGTFPLSHTWFPNELNAQEKKLGDGKVVIEIDGKTKGIWVFKKDIQINGMIDKKFETQTAPIKLESIDEMKARINKRFSVMDIMTKGLINKSIRSLIISGAPGIGKTYTLNRDLEKADAEGKIEYTILNGKMSPIGMFCKLYECSGPNSVLVLDDVDVFSSEDSLNLLKAALDTSETRKVCWSTASSYLEEKEIPQEFEFEGTIVFITNTDIDRELERGSKLAPHLDALVSRSVYLDLGVHTNEEIMVRVEDVILNTDMMFKAGLLEVETQEILTWMKDNIARLRNVSLRTALYLASFVKTDSENWKEIAEVTQLR
ncbi:thioredoxin [Acinetobacter phage AB1I1M-1]